MGTGNHACVCVAVVVVRANSVWEWFRGLVSVDTTAIVWSGRCVRVRVWMSPQGRLQLSE